MVEENNITPTDEQHDYETTKMMELGADGKLWTIVTDYDVGAQRKQLIERNLRVYEVKKKREDYFRYGLAVRLDEDSYMIVPPMDIVGMFVCKQKSFFAE